MIQIGLKLWSTNLHYVKEAARLWNEGVYDYLELTAVGGSFDACAKAWKGLNIPCVIHGPTFAQGFCFADKQKFAENMQRMKEVQRYADFLNADIIIMHPGVEGDIHETVRQLKHLNEPRIAIENKPYYVTGDLVCNGYTPDDIKLLKEEAGVLFCFDIGHALCAANALKKEHTAWVQAFLDLKPDIFHMTDGDIEGIYDVHLHLGKGNFPLEQILSRYPDTFRLTLETEHSYPDSLRDFEEDVNVLRALNLVAPCRFPLKSD